jgi:hypothetical protein
MHLDALLQALVEVVRRNPSLAGQASQRYACALLAREVSALLLVEAMLVSEVDEVGRKRDAADDCCRKLRLEAAEKEAERSRLEAEGPPTHRKRDPLDKATKAVSLRRRRRGI